MDKILVVQVAALGDRFLREQHPSGRMAGLDFSAIRSVLPAVTCTVQATMRTARLPGEHGMVANGFFSRDLDRPFFWEQCSSLIQGPRIWETFRAAGHTVGQLFWQQSLGNDSDVILSPAPIHKHHGGMIQDVYSRPDGLYERICRSIGRSFKLSHYWGPRASRKATDWIAEATIEVMREPGPDLLLTYLPHLDYDLQRSGPDSTAAADALNQLAEHLARLRTAAEDSGYEMIVFGDYAMVPVSRVVYPNLILRRAGLFRTRAVKDMLYADLAGSSAFGMVDHQICHVAVNAEDNVNRARDLFLSSDGVAEALDPTTKDSRGIGHPRSGDLVLVAEDDCWFAYPWWEQHEKAPDYATHVDIHNKPGYDPCELFWGFWPFSVSTNPARISGSHGIVTETTDAVWATTMDVDRDPEDLLGLARRLRTELLSRS